MSKRNYSTTRNKSRNEFKTNRSPTGVKGYNQKIIKLYPVKLKKLNDWELIFYNKIVVQNYQFTDKQVNKLIDISKKYLAI